MSQAWSAAGVDSLKFSPLNPNLSPNSHLIVFDNQNAFNPVQALRFLNPQRDVIGSNDNISNGGSGSVRQGGGLDQNYHCVGLCQN